MSDRGIEEGKPTPSEKPSMGAIAARMVKRAFLEAEIQTLAHELSRGGLFRFDEDKVEARLRRLVEMAQETAGR